MPERLFIVGAQRSGTTYLATLLDEHPQVQLAKPLRPEPKAFLNDERFAEGPEAYQARWFTDDPQVRVWAEKSTTYCESDLAADRIAHTFPAARILFLLREPVERAVSNYWFSAENGLETRPPAEALLSDDEPDWSPGSVSTSPFAYRRRSRYVELVDRYAARFPAEQLRLLLFEDLVASAQPLRDLYAWLGVESGFEPPSLGSPLNQSPRAAGLDPQVRATLAEQFAPYNAALAERYGLDLSAWRTTERA